MGARATGSGLEGRRFIRLILPMRLRLACAVLLGAGGLFAAGLLTPVSPVSLSWGEAALGRGGPEVAAERFDRIADVNPWQQVREEALYRAAMVYAVELGEPGAARVRLTRLAEETADRRIRARSREQLGDLAIQQRQLLVAAAEYDSAYSAEPYGTKAADRLARSARAFAEAGDLSSSRGAWAELARKFPSRRVDAWVGRAEIALATGDAQEALGLYERVLESGDLGAEPQARLGAATCLERLGNLDEALAAIDQADLPDGVRQTRSQAVRARRAIGGGAL